MRVGIIGLLHESNTFIDQPTTLDNFRADLLVEGALVRERFADAPHEIGGFFAGLEAEGIDATPIFAARATPYGTIAEDALEHLIDQLTAAFGGAGHCDGILAAVHGAAVSESYADADGYWLSRLRELAGPEIPIIATLDLHANLSPLMVDAATAFIGYRTNPHIDQHERGVEAAKLMARTLRGEVRPTMAAAFTRVAINIEKQLTSQSPCRELYGQADEMLGDGRVLSNSILLGFPYADVAEMGSSVVFVTDNNPPLAQSLADDLAQRIESNRHRFAGEFLSIDDAIDQSLKLEGPVCLLEMGDNVGGGSPGDRTELACAILMHTERPSFVCLANPLAAAAATQAGVGGMGTLLLGDALNVPYTVVSLHDGKFTESGVTHGGITQYAQGPTAIVDTSRGMTIMLTTRRVPPFSLRQLTAFGLDPASFHVIIAKGVHAPRAAYDSVCRHFLRVDTPGVTRADMTKLEYRHRRRPLFPFEELV